MTMKRAKLVVPLAACLLVACAETVEYRYLGEQVEQLTHYQPMRNETGEVVGYQEPTRAGMVIRNLEGRRIGARYTDLRSRGTNPNAEGVGITIRR